MDFKIVILMLVLDCIWLIINKKMYKKAVYEVQKSKLVLNIGAVVISYILMYLLIVNYALPLVKEASGDLLNNSLKYGGLLGIYTYGIYNFTNLALFKDYDGQVAILDTLWGGALFTLIPYLLNSKF
jgi:uncharacterized membrane protein